MFLKAARGYKFTMEVRNTNRYLRLEANSRRVCPLVRGIKIHRAVDRVSPEFTGKAKKIKKILELDSTIQNSRPIFWTENGREPVFGLKAWK
jgi:hypothetical protein